MGLKVYLAVSGPPLSRASDSYWAEGFPQNGCATTRRAWTADGGTGDVFDRQGDVVDLGVVAAVVVVDRGLLAGRPCFQESPAGPQRC